MDSLQESTLNPKPPAIMPINKKQVKAADFDPSLLRFGEIRKYATTNQPYVPVLYQNAVLLLETPTLTMPFGVGTFIPEGGEAKSGDKNIDLSFNDDREEVQSFKRKMEAVDGLVLEAMEPRSEALFNKRKTKEVLDDNHYKIVKMAKKAEYGSSMKVKWPKLDEPSFWCPAPGGGFKECDESYCKPGSTGRIIMELRPIYTVNGKFGVKWTIVQALVESQLETLTGCGFGAKEPAADVTTQAPGDEEFPEYQDE